MELTIVVSKDCINSARVLYVKAYKGISSEVAWIGNRPEWFLSLNPRGNTPTLILRMGRNTVVITEIMQILEYLDSLPGPFLYPRLPNGSVNPLEKCLIDMHIRTKIEPLFKALNSISIPKQAILARKIISEIQNNYLIEGRYFMNSYLYRNEITAADIVLLPLIDHLYQNMRIFYSEILLQTPLNNIQAWYENIKSQPWASIQTPPRL